MHADREGTVHGVAEAIRAGLRSLLRLGSAEPSDWVFHTPDVLTALQEVADLEDSDERTLARLIASRLRESINGLPPPQDAAAALLFGFDPTSKGEKLQRRRERAADLLDVQPESFRTHVEGRLLDGLAQQLSLSITIDPRRAGGTGKAAPDPRRVMIVHGRDSAAASEMRSFLRSLGLSPLDWNEALDDVGLSSPSVVERLRACLDLAQAVVILLEATEERPNVIFEAGLAFGLAPSRTVLVQLGSHQLPSDLQALHVLQLRNTAASRSALRAALERAGCITDEHAEAWRDRRSGGDLTSGWHLWTPEVAAKPALADVTEAVASFEPIDTPAGHAAASWLTSSALEEHPSVATHLLLKNGRVEGFVALAAGSIELTGRKRREANRKPLHGVQPATVIRWMARHKDADPGVGRELLLYATALALEASERLGSIALVLNAYDDATAEHLMHEYPFLRADKSGRTLWAPLLKPS